MWMVDPIPVANPPNKVVKDHVHFLKLTACPCKMGVRSKRQMLLLVFSRCWLRTQLKHLYCKSNWIILSISPQLRSSNHKTNQLKPQLGHVTCSQHSGQLKKWCLKPPRIGWFQTILNNTSLAWMNCQHSGGFIPVFKAEIQIESGCHNKQVSFRRGWSEWIIKLTPRYC